MDIKITFFKNSGEIGETKIKEYTDIDDFMTDYGFDYFKIHKGETYYDKCKERFLKGERLRYDDIGLKFDPQWFDEDDTIMEIEVV